MKVYQSVTAAIDILDNADNNRSKGGLGEIINDNIVQAFVSTTILSYKFQGL
jgi:hypothetical protein